MSVIDNKDARRFELAEEGHTAFASYRREDNQLFILHVEAPEALRGKGTAGRLMQGITEAAAEEGIKIMPICPYAAHWLNRHSGQ